MKRLITLLLFLPLYLQAQIITTIAGDGVAGYSGDNGLAFNAEFYYPIYLCLDKSGNLYISDVLNNAVRKIKLATGVITTVAGTGVGGYSGDGGEASLAQIFEPHGIRCDDSGNIYFADAANYRIRKVTVSTGVITTIVGSGIRGNSGDGGPATNATVSYAHGLCLDKLGNLFFADADANTIRKVNTAGIIITVAGTGGLGYTGDWGPATNATFNSASGIDVDASGNIFIADSYNNVIRRVDGNSGIISTVAGNGTIGFSGDGGAAVNAHLNEPGGLFIDKNSDVYWGEYPNGVVRKLTISTGIISTIAGCGTSGYAGDGGSATNAKLVPDDLSIDSSGTIYIADLINYRVRKVFRADSVSHVNICVGDSTTLRRNMANGKWINNDPQIAIIDTLFDRAIGIKSGTVSIIHEDSTLTEKFVVTVFPVPVIASNISPVTCYGANNGSIVTSVTGGTGPYKYNWQLGDSSSSVHGLAAGGEYVRVKDITTGCIVTDTFRVMQPDSMTILADIKRESCKAVDESITISVTGGTNPYHYLWSNNATNNSVTGLVAGAYSLVVTDNNNCTQDVAFTVEDTCRGIIVNNGLSPNGDGINDKWIIEGIQNYTNNMVQVFDKWGNMVFKKTGYQNDWSGDALPDGSYYYLIKLNTPTNSNNKSVLTGALIIKR